MPRAGRVHKRVAVVRRDLSLSVGVRRGPDPLLDTASAAASPPRPRDPRGRHDPRRDLLRDLADLQATGEPVDIAAPAEEHLLGDGDHRREGSDLLTQRQFCAVRRGRPGDHRVTIAHHRPVRCSSSRRRVPLRVLLLKGAPVPAPRRRSPPRNAQNCSAPLVHFYVGNLDTTLEDGSLFDDLWTPACAIFFAWHGVNVHGVLRASFTVPRFLFFFFFFFSFIGILGIVKRSLVDFKS